MAFLAPLVAGGLGAASSAGGKKAAKKQAQVQQDQLKFAQNMFNTGMQAWQPAENYWTALLRGGQAAREAVGPSAALVKDTQAANLRQLQNTLPAGGERNLAQANTITQGYRDLARLYSGVQPQAASALAQLAGIPMGVGTSVNASGTMMGPSLLNNATQTAALNQQGATGLGAYLYRLMNKNNSGGTSIGSGPYTGSGVGGGIGSGIPIIYN